MSIPPAGNRPVTPALLRSNGSLMGPGWLSGVNMTCTAIGGWNSDNGGTVAMSSDVGHPFSLGQVIKVTASADTEGARVGWPTASSVFQTNFQLKAGHKYGILFATQVKDAPFSLTTDSWQLGINAGGDSAYTTHIAGTGAFGTEGVGFWVFSQVIWEPASTIRIEDVLIWIRRYNTAGSVGGAKSIYLGWLEAYEIPAGLQPARLVKEPTTGRHYPTDGLSDFVISKYADGVAEGAANLSLGQREAMLDMWRAGMSFDWNDVSGAYYGLLFMYAEHPPLDVADNGIEINVGDDYVGLMISELDSNTVQLYADWSSGYMMQLRNRGTNKGWAVSDDGVVNGKISDTFQWAFYVAGGLSTGTNVAPHWQVPEKCRIDEVRIHVGTAPTGAALVVDVNDDGTTIFTTQGNRPSIADSTTDDTSGAPDGGTAVAKDSVLTIDIDQVGSTIAGSDLAVFVRGRFIW